VKTEALRQVRLIRKSDTVIDYVQSDFSSRTTQLNNNFPGSSVLIRVDDCFSCDAIEVRCDRVVLDVE
jgi:hypothetical protein